MLEDALNEFEGTILFISHDRYFINKVATRVIEIEKNSTHSYQGNYDSYIAQKPPVMPVVNTPVMTKSKQKQIFDKKTKNEIKKLERMIDQLEKEIKDLKKQLTQEEVINDYVTYNSITDTIEEKEIELMDIMEKWEQLQT